MDALIDLELRSLLAGETMPRARPAPSRGGSRTLLWAAALVVGVTVLYGVDQLSRGSATTAPSGNGAGGVHLQDPDAVPRPADRVFGADGAPREIAPETTVLTPAGLAALPPDTASLALVWSGSEGLEALGRLTALHTLKVERVREARSSVDVGALVAQLASLPNLERIHLDALQDVEPGDLEPIAVLPALRHVSLRGACWAGSLADLCTSASLQALDLTAFTFAGDDWQALGGARGLRHLGIWSARLEGNGALTSKQVCALIGALSGLQSARLNFTLLDAAVLDAIVAAPQIRALQLMAPTRYMQGAGAQPLDFTPIWAQDRWTSLRLRYRGEVGDAELTRLAAMRALHTFEIGRGSSMPDSMTIDERIGDVLAGMPALRVLRFEHASIDARWLAPLEGRPIESLRMKGTLDRLENVDGARELLEQWLPGADIHVSRWPRQSMEVRTK